MYGGTTLGHDHSLPPSLSSSSSPPPSSSPSHLPPSLDLFFTGAVAFSLSLLVFILFRFKKSSSGALNLPPGPKGWPIVGNLFQVALSGKPIIHYIRDLRALYGPIFTLRMGTRTLIIITNAELAHEALITKGQEFASRPPENPTRTVFSCDKFTVNSAVYGPEWRSLRRNMVSGMLSSARLKEFRPARESGMDRFIERIRAEAESSEGAVWVLKNARFAVFCILITMCFGVHLDEDSIDKIDQMMKKVLITLSPRMDDYLPLLRPFFFKQFKRALEVRKEQMQTVVPLIRKRQAILRNPGLEPHAAPFSYLVLPPRPQVEAPQIPPDDVELLTLCPPIPQRRTDTTPPPSSGLAPAASDKPSLPGRTCTRIVATGREQEVEREVTRRNICACLQAFIKELAAVNPRLTSRLTHAAVSSRAPNLAGTTSRSGPIWRFSCQPYRTTPSCGLRPTSSTRKGS
ncbi:uncharacterized protein A4U43_C09F40 [Asparagus officinalis]|uniref:Cytochrome P450 n=1 Tax=Asparagus officinalis TaxID=4686 RepID=A0A5P1E422_ASPOF|nr:uncharacterized protein A4U43_C09F40 [Asparagus officinalis]